jgi:ferritin-like metal-binding protein YciE
MAQRGELLLEHGLRDMYDAEHRFAKGLETMIAQVSDESLAQGFRRHLRMTKEQIRRLERAFDELGKSAERVDCPGSKGLIAEYEKFVKEEDPDAATLDAFAAEAGQKFEYYEIVAYRSLITLAEFLGNEACARLFRQSLAEEEQAAAELRSTSELLTAKLTGARGPGIMRHAAGTLMDQMREGALVTAGTARTVGEYATRRTGAAIQKAERRGRRAVKTAQARGRAKRTSSRPAASRARKTTRASATRRTTRAKATPRTRAGARRTSRSTTARTRTSRTRARSR